MSKYIYQITWILSQGKEVSACNDKASRGSDELYEIGQVVEGSSPLGKWAFRVDAIIAP